MPTDIFNDNAIDLMDIAEGLAESKGWNFDRVHDDQIAMAIEGEWQTYSITLAEFQENETMGIRAICTFEFEPPQEKLPSIYEAINRINNQLWGLNIAYWEEQSLITLKGQNEFPENSVIEPEWIEQYIEKIVGTCEIYYPTLQATAWLDQSPEEALKNAIQTRTMRPQ